MKDTRPASEKQRAWIKSHFREQIRSGEIDASQIDRLTMSEASGIIRRNIEGKKPLFQHYAVSRKGWSWVFTAQDWQHAVDKVKLDSYGDGAYNSGYWGERGEIDGELFGGFLNKRLCIEYLKSQGDLPVRYQNTEIKHEIKGA